MRVSDLARLAARRGATSYLQKRGYILPAVAIGANIPGAVNRAREGYRTTEHSLNRAAGEQLDPTVAEKRADMMQFMKGLAGAKPPMGGMHGTPLTMPGLAQHFGGHLLSSMIAPIVQAPAQGIADRIKGLFAPAAPGSSPNDAAMRLTVLKQLKAEDPVLSQADDKTITDAYQTMVRFAPVLSTDKNAVRSFLRQAVMSGAGPDYASIKLLADSERSVTGGKD